MNSYRKYTTCVSPSNYALPLRAPTIAILSGSVLFLIAGLMVLSTGGFASIGLWPILLPILIGLDVGLIAACLWYLHERLICLGSLFRCTDSGGTPQPLPENQECAIGVIGAPGHAGLFRPRISGLNLTKVGDNDSTMDILLAPGPTDYGADKHTYWNQVQGYLVEENSAILGISLGYPESSGDNLRYLHCEFEGRGVVSFLEFLSVILAILVGLLLVMLLLPAASLLILLLKILAGIFTFFGLASPFSPGDPGDPTDVSPSLGNLQAGDIVVVTGDWIYDSGHTGWNEIHAVHNCQKIAQIVKVTNPDNTETWFWPPDIGGGMGLAIPPQVILTRAQWCCAIGNATGAVIGGSKTDPANNWVIHPLVDGCKKPVVIF